MFGNNGPFYHRERGQCRQPASAGLPDTAGFGLRGIQRQVVNDLLLDAHRAIFMDQ